MRLTADIIYLIAGVLFLFVPFKDKIYRSKLERWSIAVVGGAWLIIGGIGLSRDLGWRISIPQIERVLDLASVVIPCFQLIAALTLLYCAWPRIQKRMQSSDQKQCASTLTPPEPTKRVCAYCGRENEKSATHCVECGTDEFKSFGPKSLPPEKPRTVFVFAPLSPTQMQEDWVTLVRCGSLAEADSVAGQLQAAGLTAFIPDQFLIQNSALNLTYGFVRVQVSPKEYEAAKELLTAPALAEVPRASEF